ncbi:non-ribosomal peptide synthetase [Bacillus glycinifermentans]|uniref:non-ribosomal peptide synthetase n=2 Tax=Bacillus glycinifermentans TaxID=1664069 RepID=UPI002DB9BD97|nr:non-ribosomal peptide synthetase [Bacillus glycinifermentans]MEC0494506.1 amino acid adenylation domain-containing protein [Bacillus glycinifermentans]MEC0539740.1 amino acid adenylation domain-containing protein [Bacillus glycinifermentans]
MGKQKIQKVYPLTPMQEGMLYHAMLDPESSSYFTQLELFIDGDFDLEIFEKSVNQLVRSYDILRTVFVYQQLQKPRQVVLAERGMKVHFEDIAGWDEARQNVRIGQYKQDVQKTGFNLAKDMLFKVAVFRLADQQYRLIWSNHHIVMDGWSMGILMKRLFENYEAFRSNRPAPLDQGRPYADYIKWLGRQDKEEAGAYWEKRLGDVESPSVIPGRKAGEAEGVYQNEEFTLVWERDLVDAVQRAANRYNVTAPNLFQAMWGAVLAKYNAADDVVFGTVVSGRPSEVNGIEHMAGLFINTIPVRLKIGKNATFAELFKQAQQHAIEAEQYDYLPLYEIQKGSALEGRLISHLVAFENYPLDKEFENGAMKERLGFSIKAGEAFEQTNYDFNLIVYPGTEWTLKLKYNSSVYDASFIEKAAEHLTSLARIAVSDPESPARRAGLLSDEEQKALLAFNDTKTDYPRDKSIPELFEEQAEQTPERAAVVYNGSSITYRRLNEKANQLARRLQENGLRHGGRAAVMMERSLESAVGMLAVLKAGGAYVPIDPDYPEDRIRFLLEDSGANIVVIKQGTKRSFDGYKTIAADDKSLEREDSANLETIANPDDLAYCIYTSGSTGKPKGVMVEHRNIVRLVKNAGYIPLHAEVNMAQTGAVSFDASTFEVFGALLNGATLFPVPKETLLDARAFTAFLEENGITTMWLTSPLFNQLAHQDPNMFNTVKDVIIGGDALVPGIVNKVKRACPALSLWNGYGPTENTTFSTCFCIDREYEHAIPIGKPIANSTAYILDDEQQLLPIGVPGELCVGGDGVARGYLNRPELTAEKFVSDPFKEGGRIYRTGDLARRLPDGNIEFLGRIDHQVKVRGFRIELGEIEARLAQLDGIREAAAIIRENGAGENEICAYYTGDQSAADVRSELSKSLPEYMIPSHFTQLEAMPLTANGKVDKRRLPEPAADETDALYQPPENETEEILAAIWEEILGIKRPGIDDNFFSVGGHSLKAMMLTAKIQEQLQKEVPIKILFEKPTIRGLAEFLQGGSKEEAVHPIEPAPSSSHYPVSSAQRRMYILNQLEEASTSYNVPAVLLLEGDLDKNRLESAFRALINRHETLRTSFAVIDGDIVQHVHEDVPFTLTVSQAEEAEAETKIGGFIRPFQLDQAPLVRAELVQLEEKRHLLLIDMHHIITDGSSTGIFIRDLAQLYHGGDLPAQKLHYKDFAVWQNEQERTGKLKKQEQYWLDVFKGELPVLDLPYDYPRPAKRSFEGERVVFGIDKKLASEIQRFLSESDTTLYMFLLAAFNIFLAKYASQDDIIVGSPVAGRTHPDLNDIPGMFVNTLALRNRPEGQKTFKEFLQEVKEKSLQAFAEQSYPLEELIEKLPLARDTSRNPLFSAFFNMQNMDVPALSLGGLQISSYSVRHRTAKFDLSLEAVEHDGEIGLSFDYATALFKEETIRRWSGHFLNVVKTICENPGVKLADIDPLSENERKTLLAEAVHSRADRREDAPFHELFERQVEKTPERTAVVCGDTKLTYRELDEKANQLAHVLRGKGAGKEDVIGIMLDRSADVIVSILGVMKAGGAFLPIDPEMPPARIRYMLEDSGASLLVTESAYQSSLSDIYKGIFIDIEKDIEPGVKKERPDSVNSGDSLAYIIYTSGTTGAPKGVQLEHCNLVNYVSWFVSEAELAESDKSVLLSSFAFDLGYTGLFPVLLAGGELHIVPKETYTEPDRLCRYINEKAITYIKLTPSLFHTIVQPQSFALSNALEPLRLIVLGGEKINPADVERYYSHYPKARFINHYGPTETTIGTIAKPIDADGLSEFVKRPTIGRPIPGAGAFVLDASRRLVPAGAPGELYITGKGLARGYLNKRELTAERFMENPYAPGTLMYQTGDLVRRLPNGEIEFLGRTDDQVKIRGYRIELKEIEDALKECKDVERAVVLAFAPDSGLEELCAYIQSKQTIASSELREHLSERLPSYMVPSYFVTVDAIPLTANGKVDRNALPEPQAPNGESDSYEPPSTELEKELCLIWEGVLGIRPIGAEDNFFDLGGHSLKGMMLTADIQAKLHKKVPLKALFEYPTVRRLARYIESSEDQSVQSAIQPAEKSDWYPVSSAQKRMYVLHHLEKNGTGYNMPSVFMMEGDLDIERLKRALQALVDRHESLRTSFAEIDGSPVQKVHDKADIELKVTLVQEGEAEKEISRFIRPFDISSAPLIRAELLSVGRQRHLLLIDTHHIIADGVSRSLFVKEIARLYRGESLPERKLHYKDYAVWQTGPAQRETIRKQEQFWLNEFSEAVPELGLPLDFPRSPVQSFSGDQVHFKTSKPAALNIRRLAAETKTTLNIVMLAVFNIFLNRLTGQKDIVVGSATAGRTHAELKDMPGMFVNSLALKNHVPQDATFREFLEDVKNRSLAALDHQDYPFEELIAKLDLPRDMSRNPLFNVMLTVEDPDKETFDLDGVTIKPYDISHAAAKFDLTLGAFEKDGEIGLQFEYATDLFKKETIRRWSGYLLNLLEAVANNPNICLSELSLLDEAEKRRIVEAWNDTALDVPSDQTIHELFEAQVSRTPDRGAAVFNGRRWTYRELNARANRLARLLIEKGARPERRIGIMVKPSLEMAAGVLSVLKAGAAYVPIDPAYPEQRIKYILEDSGAELLLTQMGAAVPDGFCGETILLDTVLTGEVTSEDEVNPQTGAKPDNLAYLIYTSGTTGRPKGVMVEHHSLVNLCYWHNHEFTVTEHDKSAKYAGFGFDASVWEMFPYWIAGSELHIIDEAIRMDIVRLNQYFEEHGITITFLPTQLCEQFMELDNKSLRVLLTGGDKLKRVEKRGYTLVNNYGPTENTVVATSTAIDPDEGMLSIGRPIANTRVYVLGEHNEVQPAGVTGELCIAGRGLARGYLNKPEETAKRFTKDPFVPGERMYRTGDAVKWLPDGRIEYIGRIDQQVKIRGFRIELSEIEVQLAKLQGVQEAAVIDIEDAHGNKALCGYVTSAETLDTGRLADQLAKTLPDYMVPAYWVQLSELPITANGKVDKRALPKPDLTVQTAEYKAPRSETEQLLADVWQEVLGVERIGISDNFFTLGGDSIKGIQMASRLQQHGLKLEMKDLFQHPTVGGISSYIESTEGKPVDQGPVEGEVMLTPIQRWFFERSFANEHHWNQSVMLHAPSGFDPEIVEQTLQSLAGHHDALRMVYRKEGGRVIQYNRGPGEKAFAFRVVNLQYVSDAQAEIAAQAERLQASLDIEKGPLMKAEQYQTADGDHLLIVIHHLVVDGVSWRILLEDFAAGYQQAAKNQDIVLPDKTNSFKDWAEELAVYAQSEQFLKTCGYWRELEKERVPALPKDRIVSERKTKDTAAAKFELTEEETRLLLTKVHEPYGTDINDILLSALSLTIREWTNQSGVCINMEGHGREEIMPNMNISRTVGWFTAQYPVMLKDGEEGLPELIKTVKETLRQIPDKGVGYGILRYVTDRQKAAIDFSIKPEISFNYLGQIDNEVQTEFFGPSPYDMGRQVSEESEALYALSFSGIISNEKLIMSCSFNTKEFDRRTVQERIKRFKHHLLSLIDHCTAKKEREFTPSDFSAGGLEMEEMGDLFDVLEENLK